MMQLSRGEKSAIHICTFLKWRPRHTTTLVSNGTQGTQTTQKSTGRAFYLLLMHFEIVKLSWQH
jgi:hypothetical protein